MTMIWPGIARFCKTLFRAAVAAAHPSTCLPPLLPAPPKGRLILLAAGKAAGSMAETAEAFYLDRLKLPQAGLPASRWRATAMGGRRAWSR